MNRDAVPIPHGGVAIVGVVRRVGSKRRPAEVAVQMQVRRFAGSLQMGGVLVRARLDLLALARSAQIKKGLGVP
jgi:hypothetical protein